MMNSKVHVIIPARYSSQRFPAKLLCLLKGKSILERTYRQAMMAKDVDSVTIAVDHKDLFNHAKSFAANVIMTDVGHISGTDRIAQAYNILGLCAEDIIINLQADEPFINPIFITHLARTLNLANNCQIATLCTQIKDLNLINDLNTVKVVFNKDNEALYFSRSVIPKARDIDTQVNIYKHIGLYAYRGKFLNNLDKLSPCALETVESLEQLRFLWHGYKIKLAICDSEYAQDINTWDDLQKAIALLERNTKHLQ